MSSVAPTITAQPLRQSVRLGQSATFKVIATGTAQIAYQWFKNGSAVSGATLPVYTTPATNLNDDSSLYSVVVSNSAGSVTSVSAVLTVNATAGQLVTDSSSINFGSLMTGIRASANFTLTNTSAVYATISSVNISGTGFAIDGIPASFILAPGDAITATVYFAPVASGSFNGTVSIASDASPSPLTVSLAGVGTAPTHAVTVSWAPSTSSVFGYFVYRALGQSGPIQQLNSTPTMATQYIDTNVLSGQTYVYWVTSVDSNTVEGQFSNATTAAIPTP